MAKQTPAPTKAPAQKVVETGKGPLAKGQHQAPGALAPQPPSAATTGPKIASPSVNYDAGQETPANVKHLGASGRDYADEQAQRT